MRSPPIPAISQPQWRGLQVAAAELLPLAFPNLTHIYLKQDTDSFVVHLSFSPSYTEEDQKDCQTMVSEIFAAAMGEPVRFSAWQAGLSCPSDNEFVPLLTPEILERMPPEVAPWRGKL